MIRRRWPWLVAVASVTVYVVAVVVGDEAGLTLENLAVVAIYVPAITSLALVGALLVDRVPSNMIGYLLLLAGALMSVAVTLGTYATLGATATPGPWPGVGIAAFLNEVLFIVPLVITLIGVPLVFPDGRFLGPRWRWIAWLTVVAMVATTVAEVLRPAELIGGVRDPFGVPELMGLAEALDTFSSVSSIVAFGGAAASVIVRFRRSRGVEREQLKWLGAVAGVAAFALPLAFLAPTQELRDVFFLIGLITFVATPVAIGVAILRYRLYEIDRIISRTIGYTILTGGLAVLFVATVVALQAVLSDFTQGQTIAVAASTLVAFAAFQPLRRRIQRAIDRRFDRARYDAERTSAAFAGRLRDEVDIDAVTGDLRATVTRSIRPAAMGLWIRDAGALDR